MTKMVVIFDLLTVMAIGWGVYGIVAVLGAPSRYRGPGWTAAILALVCLGPMVDQVLRAFVFDGPSPVLLRALDRSSGYLIGPLLWIYTDRFLDAKPAGVRKLIPHFVPFAVIMGISFIPSLHMLGVPPFVARHGGFLGPPQGAAIPARSLVVGHPLAPALQNIGKFVSVLIYGVVVLARIRRRDLEVGDYYSNDPKNANAHWLRGLMVAYLAVFFASTTVLLYFIATHTGNGLKIVITNSVPLIVFLFFFVYFTRTQTVPEDVRTARLEQSDSAGSADGEKYLRSGLSDNQVERLYTRLVDHLEAKKSYLEPEISLASLAEELRVSRHHLSQAINTKTSGNFYAFINKFRVKEFVRSVQTGDHKTKTLIGIALDCGFNSYATFYNTFKRLTGTTPRDFILKNTVQQPA